MTKTKNRPHSTRWSRSAAFRAVGLGGLVKARAKLAEMPRCTARSKTTGGQCRQVALPNGKCYYHGGATPRNEQWHRLQLPAADTKHELGKFIAKQLRQTKSAKKRDEMLRHLTLPEKARLNTWVRSHRPGSKESRAAARALARDNEEARQIFAKPSLPSSPEVQRLQLLIEELRARLIFSSGGVFD